MANVLTKLIVLFVGLFVLLDAGMGAAQTAAGIEVRVLSSRPDMVSGGNALVEVIVPAGGAGRPAVTADGRDVSAAFQATDRPNVFRGLVERLAVGRNIVTATAGSARGELALINHPIEGPITSGPHRAPHVCTTEENGLGKPLDADCSAPSKVEYFYRTRGFPSGEFKPLPDRMVLPNDAAETTRDGRRVPYVVRVESGVINRAVYRIAILDDPRTAPTPWKPGPAWNGRLVYSFGGGCGAAYNQGRNTPETVLNDLFLSRGFANVTSTANVLGQFCNDALSGETAMMIKEYFTERYGLPVWTVGSGGSGGAMQQHLIAQNFPGVLDGLMPTRAFADTMGVWVSFSDCRLMAKYFADASGWTLEQRQTVEGFSPGTCRGAENYMGTLVASNVRVCNIAPELVYDPVKNPKGARCTYWDSNVNTFGRDPVTGAARRTSDNVGVQYGLAALNGGKITTTQFLDLNARIGGYDNDGTIRGERSVADPEALRLAYAAGRINTGGGSLGSIPIISFRAYLDDVGDVHDRYRDFQMRARIQKAHARSDNYVSWLSANGPILAVQEALALDTMSQWLDALVRDTSSDPAIVKVVRAKPARAVDACWDRDATRIDEPFSDTPSNRCNALFPYHTNPRIAAGAPLVDDALKCATTPLNRADYKVTFTDAEWRQVTALFPNGVCDWSKPGIGYRTVAGTYQRLPPPAATSTRDSTAGTQGRSPDQACAALGGMRVTADRIGLPTRGATVTTARLVAATAEVRAQPAPGNPSGVTMARPEYCEVNGEILPVDATAPPIRFQVNLPTNWNGKAIHQGGGGYDGVLVTALGSFPRAPDTTPYSIARGYATFGSDGGHEGNNASFALNGEALLNFAYGHLKKTRDVALTLIDARYGTRPTRTYFIGQSGGGRQGMMVAQRFPQDYDGVIVTAPAIKYANLMLRFNDVATALARPGAFLGPEQIKAFDAAVRAQCDTNDGIADGIVGDYLACNFDRAVLRCHAGEASASPCFSDAQLEALATVYRERVWKDDDGHVIMRYPRFLVAGGESHPGNMAAWITGKAPLPRPQPAGQAMNMQQLGLGVAAFYGNSGVRYLIAKDGSFDTFAFDPRPYAQQVVETVKLLASDDPNLRAFHDRGGKLIVLHNTADLAVTPVATIEYYDEVVKTLGASTAQQFVRLYIVPGGDHGGANAPSKADLLGMLERWVENGRAPGGDVVAEEYGPERKVIRSKPLCPYPTFARYAGQGDPNTATSYRCVPITRR